MKCRTPLHYSTTILLGHSGYLAAIFLSVLQKIVRPSVIHLVGIKDRYIEFHVKISVTNVYLKKNLIFHPSIK